MSDDSVKALWKLFLMIGPNLDLISDSNIVMNSWFKQVEEFIDNNKTKDPTKKSVRMLTQIFELRKKEWISELSNKPAEYFEQKILEFLIRNKFLSKYDFLDELLVKYL